MKMNPTNYPDINDRLNLIVTRHQEVLGTNLVGLYLYGSLVWGDFDYDISDLDLLTVTVTPLDQKEFTQLKILHDDFMRDNKDWDNRLEIAYVPLSALQTFKSETSEIAVISPGEPFHRKDAGKDWLINWYIVQEKGLTLSGVDFKTLIAPISKAEYLQAVREQAEQWREYIINTKYSRPYQGYAILTMCRALYTVRNGEQVSKKQAAIWAKQMFPQWADLIRNALVWRDNSRETVAEPEATYPQTVQFVNFIAAQIRIF